MNVVQSTCDESEFCIELGTGEKTTLFSRVYGGQPSSRIIARTERVAVLVDIAPLVEGHLLTVPVEHNLSIGHLSDSAWGEFNSLASRVCQVLESTYGSAVIFEHGSSMTNRQANSCVEHAHWHLLPVPGDLREAVLAEGILIEPVDDVRGVLRGQAARDLSYLYVESRDSGTRFWAPDLPPAAPQLVRRVIARHLGIEDPLWDFGVYQQRRLLRRTVARLEGLFE